jgi:hypothetical protein
VTLRPLADFNLEEVRRLTGAYVRQHAEVIEQYFEQSIVPEAVVDLVARSSTCAELFDAFGVPAPQNSLDSLKGPFLPKLKAERTVETNMKDKPVQRGETQGRGKRVHKPNPIPFTAIIENGLLKSVNCL